MKLKLPVIAAALLCCISCIKVNSGMGGNLIPVEQTYKIFTTDIPLTDIDICMADSLSGYSQTRFSVGAIDDEEYGLSTRSAALTLIPMFADKLDLGTNRKFKRFHLGIARDSINVSDESQVNILQNMNVYELEKALDPDKDYDCNAIIAHGSNRITSGVPVFSGGDSLSLNFSKEFGEKYLTMTNDDVASMDKYLKRFPGIYIECDKPSGGSGRINLFDVQLSYDSQQYFITGNYATLNFEAEFNGVRKDTALYFYIGALDFFDLDSLLTKGTAGAIPQYVLTLTGHQTRGKAGKAGDKICVEGGGGLKPVISARYLKGIAEEAIAKVGGIPSEAVINKASLVFPFEFPDDYKEMDKWPDYLSPTCRIKSDKGATFMGLTDSSSSDENQGDINRSTLKYAPDITYHLQEILKIDESKDDIKSQRFANGSYDVWFLIMANETVVTQKQTDSEMSDYYNYLAYSSYYNSMYGGYGGYGGYGYGYGNSYSNYYTYAMLASMANNNSSTTQTKVQLDKDRFYKAELNGPACTGGRVPTLELTFSIPNKTE